MSASLRTLRRRGGWRGWTLLGWASLAVAAVAVIALPAGWPSIILAGVAVAALSVDPRLGPIAASLLVALAIPFGLGADTVPVAVGGWPVRPQDAAIAVGLLGLLVPLGAPSRLAGRARLRTGDRTLVAAVGLFALIGLLALVEGFAAGHALRDVLRDARWWLFYLAAPLALVAGVPASNVLRAILLGTAVFAAVVVATMVLPAFGGGLKAAGLAFYSGSLRMQFGNTVFLLPALAWAVRSALVRRAPLSLLVVALLFTAVVVSLTRTTILVSAGVVLLVLAAHAVSSWRGGRWRIGWGAGVHRVLAVAAVLLIMVVTTVGAIGFSTLTTAIAAQQTGSPAASSPFKRLIFSEEGSDIDAILESGVSGGRIGTYLAAYSLIQQNWIVGQGMGQLVRVRFANDPARAHTRGQQPGVDNAYLTVGMKAGAVGITAFAAMLLVPLVGAWRRARRTMIWFVPAWLGILALTLTQSFAVSGYAPFGLALLAALPFLPISHDRLAASASAGEVSDAR
jgi:hypothetical protein